ncbi:MAG TPA: hypothetical protein VL737_03035 [Candidatus Pristimantibacillus sp.]|jgi:hypothetical protein|nr:hypothetical protein [Candidatus Pristimantibacillus sp.]
MTPLGLTLFAIGWLVGIYIFNSAIARSLKKIQPARALLYVSTVAMLGVFGEIFVDTVYAHFFHTPLWRYNTLPIHHAYTSSYAVVLWGAYGFHLYLLHDSLGKWSISKQRHLALIFAAEALVLEALVEITSKLFLGEYLYYYYPNGLWHISAFQNFPFYLICGFLIVKTIKRFSADPAYFTFINGWLTVMLVFFL